MFRFVRYREKHSIAALLCVCWIALTFAVPLAPSLRPDHRATELDCVSAAVPASLPYSDTSIDESSTRLLSVTPRIDFGGLSNFCDPLIRRASHFAVTTRVLGSGVSKPSLLALGILLRL